MQLTKLTSLLLGAGLLVACGDNGGNGDDGPGPDAAPPKFATNSCSKLMAARCMEIASGDAGALATAANSIEADTTIVLDAGTYPMTNQLTFRTKGVHLVGQGIDKTTLDFGDVIAQSNGVDVIGDDFLIQDLTVLDAKKDGIRVEQSSGVVFRRIRATWTTPSLSSNGAYGIYPVKSQNVLVEDSRAENASDAGLYVGQCQHVIVRNNIVRGNVAGLEIENTQYADVYGNTAEDNTGGIVVFDLPGNPIVGRDVRIRDNMIKNNNHENFASGGTVASIPVGTGTFAMASRRVEITGNTYEKNDTVDISIISGLAIESTPASWVLDTATLQGKFDDLGLEPAGADKVMNFRSENIVVANNKHSGSGTKADIEDPLMLGLLLRLGYGADPVDNVLYDAIEETFEPATPLYTNNHHICVGGNTNGTFGSLALDRQSAANQVPFYRPAKPFAPFDCTALEGGPVAPVVLP
ncbi:MAG: right-handed parallel beta-helix repeat-containing protein [Myxococcales bacterium]|nr:right-handed parallel beta-helix repeat-containing protein [Myxococcales bacterium]